MRFSRAFFCSVATLLLGCVAALTQVGNQVQSLQMTNRGGAVSGFLTLGGSGLQAMRPITGQPYSAEQESEHSQTLADGTHIQRKGMVSRLYRDSEGRTRTERVPFAGLRKTAGEEVPTLIQIFDPVEGYSYTLDSQKHIAHRVAVEVRGAATGNVNRAPGTTRELALARKPAGLPVSSRASAGRELKNEPLGTQEIEGVPVEGTRITITTPAGAEGNDRPLAHVCERWHSAELDLTLLSKCTDPRSGRIIMRMLNLDRGEPDPALFRVPADYTVVDETGRFTMRFGEAQSVGVIP
jgi:hypothetical protein